MEPAQARSVEEAEGEWRVVRTRKPKPRHPPRACHTTCSPGLTDSSEDDAALLHQKLHRSKARVQNSAFYSALTTQLQHLRILESLLAHKTPDHTVIHTFLASLAVEDGEGEAPSSKVDLVVLGVGSLSNSEVARSQMSLALLLKEDFPSLIGTLSVYDPVLSSTERELLTSLGCVAMEREVLLSHSPTLFYMPHCGASLYDRLLQENLDPWRLAWVCILGNSFLRYQERWAVTLKARHARPECLLAMQRVVVEHAVDAAAFPCLSAFNDMSWHLFPLKCVGGGEKYVSEHRVDAASLASQ